MLPDIRHTWIVNRCQTCQHTFRRMTGFWAFDIADDLCFDCYLTHRVGEPCDVVIVSTGDSIIARVGTAERYELAARAFPNRQWYALTMGHTLEILTEPLFHGVPV